MMQRLLVLLTAICTTASAGLVEPLLEEQLAAADGTQKFGVMVVLDEQLDAEAIIRTIKDKDQRWTTTVAELQSMAQRTQTDLLNELDSYAAQGAAADIRPLWIVNAVYCRATSEVIHEIAGRPDVWLVQWDLIPTENALALAPVTADGWAAADATDDEFSVEWNVKKVKADSVWQVYGHMGEGVVVGDIDSGCDYNHSDLAGHMWTDPNYPNHGWDFENNDDDPMDSHGHGTHTCGTVAGDGTGGDTTGMAPKAAIMSCRGDIYLSQPFPDTIAENTMMNSMQFCVAPPLSPANHAHLLTMSIGWQQAWSPRRAVWRQALANVAAAGLPFFIAAGNEGGSVSPPYSCRTPADCPGPWKHPAEASGGLGGSITVGATEANDDIAGFSSRGPVRWDTIAPYNDYPFPPGLLRPDFSAPGVGITSTKVGGGYTQMSGTSMATPCAAGVCALMLSRNPNLLPEEVDEIMQSSVKPLGAPPKNNIYGTGRIDAMLCIANTPEQVQGHDVEMYKVLAPPDRIDPLTPLAPVVVVRNLGTHAESDITVHCKVDSMGTQVYHETLTVAQLELRDSDTATFPEWNVGPGGQTYNLTFWHAQASDTGRANDTIRQTTTTLGHDVRSIGMNIPARVRQNAPLVPRLTLSSGDYTEKNFRAFCRIDSAGEPVYRDSVLVDSVPQQASRTFAFPSAWNVGPKDAAYHVKMWHNCGPDQNRTNDTTTVTTVAIEQPRFLILYADYGAPDTTLGARLRALGDSVEYMDVRISTPGLDQLMPFDAVGALSNFTYFDNEALGDTLATYVDSGGGVVIGNLSFATGTRMAGRIMTGDFATIEPGPNALTTTTLGWYSPVHPIMDGVDSVREFHAVTSTFSAGAESVARWADGRPYVAVSANHKVVGLNQYPGIHTMNPPQRGGDWGLVWHNALAFVSGPLSGVGEFDPFAPEPEILLSIAPNPARNRMAVSYTAPAGSRPHLDVFDRSGRLVRNLSSGPAKPGLNQAVWDLKNAREQRVAAGVYFCRLVTRNKTQTRKLVVE